MVIWLESWFHGAPLVVHSLLFRKENNPGDLRKRVLLASPASSSFDDSQQQELPKRALIIVSDDKDQ